MKPMYNILLPKDIDAPMGTIDGRTPQAIAQNWVICQGVYDLSRAQVIAANFHNRGFDCMVLQDDIPCDDVARGALRF